MKLDAACRQIRLIEQDPLMQEFVIRGVPDAFLFGEKPVYAREEITLAGIGTGGKGASDISGSNSAGFILRNVSEKQLRPQIWNAMSELSTSWYDPSSR